MNWLAKATGSLRSLSLRPLRNQFGKKGFRSSKSVNTSHDLDSTHPSGTQVSLAATLLLSIVTFSIVFGPRAGEVAEAADPQGPSRYSAVARIDPSRLAGSGDLASSKGSSLDLGSEGDGVGAGARIYFSPEEVSRMRRVQVGTTETGGLSLGQRPELRTRLADRYVDRTQGSNYVFYTIDARLQEFVERITAQANASHVAVVAMNPKTGAILALAGKSGSIANIEYHAGFPAASLFKVVTAAAAIEQAGIQPESMVAFRGGTYTLNEANYLPNARLDRRMMSVGEALGRSCNPVIGQLGSRYLNGFVLAKYARLFGFNQPLALEAPLANSAASVPTNDLYELSRTSAGFGEVRISPIHAAAIMSGIANGGLLPKPQLVEKVVSPDGAVLHRPRAEMLQRIVRASTALTLLQMMEYTTTVGTSRREFQAASAHPTLGALRVAAKTGTLKGINPVGLNNWFIAAAPIENPELAIAVITVDPGASSKASHLGRRVFEQYFNITPSQPERVTARSTVRSTRSQVSRKRTTKKATYRSISPKKKSKVAAGPNYTKRKTKSR